MNVQYKTPARQLVGQKLHNGWTVIKLLKRPPDATGGAFSASYDVVSESGRIAFLKAMDFTGALGSSDPARALQTLTEVYNFERDVLEKCSSRKLSRIVRVLDSGKIAAKQDDASSVVQYLVFEKAKGDIRSYAPAEKKPLAWALRRLHQVAAALRQLHFHGIAHQDVKPSNVLVFERENTKLADLGRASDRGIASPFDTVNIAGDLTYAPPELLYGEIRENWNARRLACDMYLLGSMAMYFFAGTSMTHLLLKRLDRRLHPMNQEGEYKDILEYKDIRPYIEYAFNCIIREIKEYIPDRYSEEIGQTIRQLCNPDPERRGHPKGLASKDSVVRYSVERYVSAFDRLAGRAEYDIKLSSEEERPWLV